MDEEEEGQWRVGWSCLRLQHEAVDGLALLLHARAGPWSGCSPTPSLVHPANSHWAPAPSQAFRWAPGIQLESPALPLLGWETAAQLTVSSVR